jgi:hypothetical protein
MGSFQTCSVLPIADESCIIEEDVAKATINYGKYQISKMRRINSCQTVMIQANGLKTMVGCMTESSVEFQPLHICYHWFYVDMDGALLLAEDIANGVTIKETKNYLF